MVINPYIINALILFNFTVNSHNLYISVLNVNIILMAKYNINAEMK